MVKLCWKRKRNGEVEEYFYAPEEKRVYHVCLATYNSKSKKSTTINIGIMSIGVCASAISYVSKLVDVSIGDAFQTAIIILFFLSMYLINKSVKQSNLDREKYILEKGNSRELSTEDVRDLFICGKKAAIGYLVFVIISLVILFIGVLIYLAEKDVMSVILTFLGGISAIIFLNLMEPIKRYRVRRMLYATNKSEGEDQ